MSFRYTNNLIGVLKHRLTVEAAYRDIARRTFHGVCNGVEVTCSGYGTVLAIRLVDKKVWEPFYTRRSLSTASSAASPAAELAAEGEATTTTTTSAAPAGSAGLDLAKLSHSIRTATWEANRLIRAAKEEAHARAVLHNPESRARGDLRDWYETDATSMRPHPRDALKEEAATPWMRAVRFGKANASLLTAKAAPPPLATSPTPVAPLAATLNAADCDPLAIPVGATHPLHLPALVQIEARAATAPAMDATLTGKPNLSRADARVVLGEQRKELARDEERFWETVELIRRGQLASIPNGAKRGYANMSAVVTDTVEEKIDLKFTQ